MPAKKKPASKMKDLKARSVSDAKAKKTKGGSTSPRDPASGLPTGKRMH